MDDLSLLVDLHRESRRQGPGGDDETRLAITLSGLSRRTGLKIADIGCGTGASTLVLAKALDASVTAVDFLPDFLHDLDIAAERQNLGKKIKTLSASMDALPFEEQSFDALWSEGARKVVGVMHKDAKKFAATGGWGFEGFGGGDPKNRVVGANAATACFACHQPQKAQDYTFSRLRD